MLTLIAALTLGQSPAVYNPTGPKLEVLLSSGAKFVIATDTKQSPKTTARIVALVKSKFYDGQKFHRVEDWVVQWGDPASRKSINPPTGSGGSGKAIPYEKSTVSFSKGCVGIASTGAGLGGDSQLFVVKKDSSFLTGSYAMLGKVTSGMAAVDRIAAGATIKSIRIVK